MIYQVLAAIFAFISLALCIYTYKMYKLARLVKKSGEIEKKWADLLAVLESMSDAIAVVDAEGGYIFRNRTSRESFPDAKVVAGDGYASQYYDMEGNIIKKENLPTLKVLRGTPVIAERMKVVYKDHERYFSISATPVYNHASSIEYAVISSREITDIVHKEDIIRKQQEKLLKAEIDKNNALQNTLEKINTIAQLTELNSLKDKLLTVVTHDIRNPMATMISLIELLEEEKKHFSDESREIIEAVNEQINNTYTIVENLLEWLKSQKEGLFYSPQEWNLSSVIREVVGLYRIHADVKDIRITMDIAEDMTVFADKEMLELVLRNLLSNALKFTGRGGVIFIRAYHSRNEIIVAIKDTGIGIDFQKAKTLFDRKELFSNAGTAGEQGTGLGLLICKEFVQYNRGKIWVDSMQGKGSTFLFSLLSGGKVNRQGLNNGGDMGLQPGVDADKIF